MAQAERAPDDAKTVRKRVQLDFTQSAFERLLELKESTDAQTNAEVVRNALRLYDWFISQKREGGKIHVVKDDEVKEVELIF